MTKKAAHIRNVMAEKFNIRTDAELDEALKKMEPVDLGIFVSPYEKLKRGVEKNEQKERC